MNRCHFTVALAGGDVSLQSRPVLAGCIGSGPGPAAAMHEPTVSMLEGEAGECNRILTDFLVQDSISDQSCGMSLS